MKTYSSKLLRFRNQRLILKLLKTKGPLSRADLAKKIGLVRSTVSDITNKLIDSKVIIEGKKVKGNLGKRPTLLYFNKNYYYYAALVITPDRIDAAICNLNGETIAKKNIQAIESNHSREVLNLAFSSLDSMLEENNINGLRLISLGSPETFNKNTGVIRWAPYIKDWVGLDLAKIFKDKYNTEVIIKDHVKLETLGEQWKGYNNVSNMVYLIVTKGIGAGVVIDGKVREGKNGYLGEIAFLPLAMNLNYNNLKGTNNNLGYFESQCDIKRIEEIAAEYYKKQDEAAGTIPFAKIAESYRQDPAFRDLINEKILKTLALGIAATAVVLDPEIIVINGEIVELKDGFLQSLKEEVYAITPYRGEIAFSKLKENSGIYGAIKNGLDYIDFYINEHPNNFFQI
ncbi:MAG: ROK family transcriptional regulator [Actinomycetota bacterium]|nr:ROK family transcriptional regulator [Actinomycetota bacterium]